jgi:DNA processing protein
MIKDNIYWIAVSGLKNMKTEEINNLIIDIYINKKSNIADFFRLQENEYDLKYSLKPEIIEKIVSVKKKYPELEEVKKNIEKNSIKIIPVNSNDYSQQLKNNLKITRSPSVLFVKGDITLLNQPSVAIVGSRSASDISLNFTDSIAKKLVGTGKVIVSGYAKGVDRQALDSALKYNGKSIIVLPQGILTYISGMKNYESEIDRGNLLILSTYYPKMPWSVPLAMGRNSIIYGLAEEIYVAESNNSGGTWSGVLEGLKRNQKIFVRKAIANEKNANNKLIEKGATPLYWGKEIEYETSDHENFKVSESLDNTEERILKSVSGIPKSSRDIKDNLKIDWSVSKITAFLKKQNKIEVIKSKPMKFVLKSKQDQKSLFE